MLIFIDLLLKINTQEIKFKTTVTKDQYRAIWRNLGDTTGLAKNGLSIRLNEKKLNIIESKLTLMELQTVKSSFSKNNIPYCGRQNEAYMGLVRCANFSDTLRQSLS
jgi:hypothetical protein